MLETLMFKQGKKVLGLNAIAFKTSSATETTITTSQLGSGFTTEYSIDGGTMATSGASFIIPSGTHEVALKLDVTTGTLLNMIPFKDIITEVTDWEGFQLSNIRFSNCTKLTKVPDQLPVPLTDLSYMFLGCTSFNQDISGWNTSQVTNVTNMFSGCTSFNQPIGNWDTSNVTNMRYMFNGCTSFNQDIGGWDVSRVTEMDSMFQNCTYFNQDIGQWNTGNVSSMRSMFRSCVTFNQDIGDWDTSKVKNMYGMLYGCLTFNQNISGWNVNQVTDIRYMFFNCAAFNKNLSSMVFKSTVTMNSYDGGATSWNAAYRPKFTG